MHLRFLKSCPLCLRRAALLTFSFVASLNASAIADDDAPFGATQPVDVLTDTPSADFHWIAVADEQQVEGKNEPTKHIIHKEVRRLADGGLVTEEEVERIEKADGQGNVLFFNFRQGEEAGRYWIGVECHDASPELRAHLGLEDHQGLVVVRVSEDSAAAKAGLKRHDVVVAANDSKLSHVPDLAKAVNAAEGKAVTLKIIRGGKEQSIEVTPTERPADVVKFIARPHAGMFVSSGPMPMGPRLELPDNMTIKVERQGKKPATISVTRGDDKFETTEEQLDKLPADIRPLVERALGTGPWTMPLPPGRAIGAFGATAPPMMHIEALPGGMMPGKRVTVRAVAPGAGGPAPVHPGGDRPHGPVPPDFGPAEPNLDVMKRLEMLDRRLEQMQDEIRRLRDDRPRGAHFERRDDRRGDQDERRDRGQREVEIEVDDRPAPRPSR